MMADSENRIIKTPRDLLEELDIDSIDRITDYPVQRKFFELCESGAISESILKELIRTVPSIAKVCSDFIVAPSKLACEIEKTKQAQWEFLKALAQNGTITSEQTLDAMKILLEHQKQTPETLKIITDNSKQIGKGIALILASVAVAVLISITAGIRKN